jgi:lysophospholipase L1-like esterase
MVNDQKGLNAAYSGDGVHPNKTGYEVMNPLVEKAISKVLSKK